SSPIRFISVFPQPSLHHLLTLIRYSHTSQLFPYTTLFRSCPGKRKVHVRWQPIIHVGRTLKLCFGDIALYRRKQSFKVLPTWIIDRKSTRLNSSHVSRSYAVFCL